MKDQLVSFETAKLAKEKKFNEPCLQAYRVWRENIRKLDKNSLQDIQAELEPYTQPPLPEIVWFYQSEQYTLAPTKSLLQKWLRENYSIIVEVTFHMDGYAAVVYDIRGGIKGCKVYDKQMTTTEKREFRGRLYDKVTYHEEWEEDHKTYEDALEKGLQEGLKLLI